MMLFFITTCIMVGWSSGQKTVEVLSSKAVNHDITPVTSSPITENKLQENSHSSDSYHNKLEDWNKVSDGNHHKITKRNSLSHDEEIGFYSKLIKDLQELIDREQDFFPDEKRYFGRYRRSNHLIKSLNEMKSDNRDFQIGKLIRSRRSVEKSHTDSSRHGEQSLGNDNKYIMNTVRNLLNQSPDQTKNSESDKSSFKFNPLQKRFFGRVRNSNYILTQQKLGNDIKELLKNHWNSNWNKRMVDVVGAASPKHSTLTKNLSLPKKRFQVDLDYSFLWSLMMNKDKEAAERALKMYMNP